MSLFRSLYQDLIGRTNQVVSEDTYALVVSVAIVSFILSALLVPLAPSFGDKMAIFFRSRYSVPGERPQHDPPPEVAIIGFGPAGQIASRALIDQGIRVTVIDLNQAGIRKAQQQGFRGEVGDATQSDVLEHAQLRECKAIVITVPHHESAMTILQQVRSKAPHAHILVRSRHELHAGDLVAAGGHVVAGDEQQVGVRLANALTDWLAIGSRLR